MLKAVNQTDLTMICVGTPQNSDGSSDLQFIIDAAHTIGKALGKSEKYHTVIVKSTVLPGTTSNVGATSSREGIRKRGDSGFWNWFKSRNSLKRAVR